MKLSTSLSLILAACLTLPGLISCNGSQHGPEVKKDTIPKVVSRPARFSILQSTLAAKETFKLDSYTGDVYQLVVDSGNSESWQVIKRIPTLELDTRHENYRNYNLFLSTIAVRFTYLINVNTGATWQLQLDPSQESIFAPITTH